jgi:hypothetical protein
MPQNSYSEYGEGTGVGRRHINSGEKIYLKWDLKLNQGREAAELLESDGKNPSSARPSPSKLPGRSPTTGSEFPSQSPTRPDS